MKNCDYCGGKVENGQCPSCGASNKTVYSSSKQADPVRQYRVTYNGEVYRVEMKYWSAAGWFRKAGWSQWYPTNWHGQFCGWWKEYSTLDEAKSNCDRFSARFGCFKPI